MGRTRQIASRSEELWRRWAPWASASFLARQWPKSAGGLTVNGWNSAINACRGKYDLDWLPTTQGIKPVLPDEPLPEPVFVDELQTRTEPRKADVEYDPELGYKESVEILADGNQRSDKLLEMSAEQCKDPTFLLEAHGFDPAEWELVTAKNNIWNVYSKNAEGDGHDISTLYSSKITVKPNSNGFTLDDLITAFRGACTPVHVESPTHGEMLLELGYTDAHFGSSTIEHYRDTIARSVELIRSKVWKRIVIWTGSDFFHCNNFQNTTIHGTALSSVWWPDAYKDGLEFIGTIIEEALANGVEVHVVYIPGNHDESMAWMFANVLRERYPDAIHDTEIQERKVHVFGECAIGMTHGDEKTRKDLDRVFGAEFREFACALHREVHMGHLHHESTKDNYGVVSRSLPTKARTDKWHREEGFVGARKRFQVFEWDASAGVTDIHYV